MADQNQEPILTKVARTIGKAAGTVASLAGVHADSPAAQPGKRGKLASANKRRLPRKQKKMLKKQGAWPPPEW